MAKIKKTSTLKDLSLNEYVQTLTELKQRIQEAQIKAAFAVNKELLKLYWSIGKTIAEKQETLGWGTKVIDQLVKDLQKAFPGIQGFSRSNISYMRAFFVNYAIIQQPAGQLEELPIFNIPWFHNVIIFQKIKDPKERLWYAKKSIEYGWSRSMLETWIKSDLYHRDGKAKTNFSKTLPLPQSDMAQQSLKDPYIFDFLTLHKEHLEKDLEDGLISHVEKLLLELGKGFALMGRQHHLIVSDEDYYIDLLFYHTKLKCYVVVELKAQAFNPKDIGQLNFYLSACDDILRDATDNPTIGLLLCKGKNNVTVEYALRGVNRPIGVAEYETTIMSKLPKNLKSSLPTIEEIEAELEKQDLLNELEAPKAKESKTKTTKTTTKSKVKAKTPKIKKKKL